MHEKKSSPLLPADSSYHRILFQPTPPPSQPYLLGLRGLLAIQSFLWTFLQVFAPLTVADSPTTPGPLYQNLLRRTLSPLFWNPTLIASSIILLSARTVALPFLSQPTKSVIASAVFRRGLRFWPSVAVTLALVKILSSTIGTSHITAFTNLTRNTALNTPYTIPNTLAYFNSVFNIFWTTSKFAEQAGNTAFPAQTLWVLNVVYAQSYTAYMTMVIIPYTRPAWRVKAYACFILTAWWVQSWAWYTITGLAFADAVVNMDFQAWARRGVQIPGVRRWRLPTWVVGAVLIASGWVMQYLWTAWRPEYRNRELRVHTGLYYTGGLNTQVDSTEPQARDDDYLVILGFYVLMETYPWLQHLLGSKIFLFLGRRSLGTDIISPPSPLLIAQTS